jgi:hypothetical protein
MARRASEVYGKPSAGTLGTRHAHGIVLHDGNGDQIWIKTSAGRSWIVFEPHPGDTYILTGQGGVMNPIPGRLEFSYRPPFARHCLSGLVSIG